MNDSESESESSNVQSLPDLLEIATDETGLLSPGSESLQIQFDVGNAIEIVGQGRYQKIAVACLGVANASDAVEILAIGYILAVFQDPIQHQDIDTEGGVSGLLSASVFAGMLVGGLFSGYLGDNVGRRPVLLSTLSVNFMSSIGSSFTLYLDPNMQIPWFIICRFVGGAGVGGSVPAVFALASEMCTDSARGLYVTIVAWFWMVGALYTATMGWVIIGSISDDAASERWPIFALTVAIPAGTASMLARLFVYESPRYLESRGKRKDAIEVLHRIAMVNKTSRQFTEYVESVPISERIDSTTNGIESQRLVPKLLSFTEIRKHKDALVPLCIVWYCLSYGGYGIGAWISDLFKNIGFENVYGTSFFYALGNLPGNIGATILIDRINRKVLVSGCMLMAAFASVLFAIGKYPVLILTGAVVFNTFVIGSWNGLNVLSAESFPPKVRSSAFGIISAMGRLGSVSGTLLNGILLGHGFLTAAILLAGVALVIGSVTVIKFVK